MDISISYHKFYFHSYSAIKKSFSVSLWVSNQLKVTNVYSRLTELKFQLYLYASLQPLVRAKPDLPPFFVSLNMQTRWLHEESLFQRHQSTFWPKKRSYWRLCYLYRYYFRLFSLIKLQTEIRSSIARFSVFRAHFGSAFCLAGRWIQDVNCWRIRRVHSPCSATSPDTHLFPCYNRTIFLLLCEVHRILFCWWWLCSSSIFNSHRPVHVNTA